MMQCVMVVAMAAPYEPKLRYEMNKKHHAMWRRDVTVDISIGMKFLCIKFRNDRVESYQA